MSTQKKAPATAEAQTNKSRTHNTKIRRGTKLHSVISHLAAGHTLHRFQAERICHDHVLNSTVAGFQRDYGIPVARKKIVVPGWGGSKVTVCEYWMTPDAQRAAAKLLEG